MSSKIHVLNRIKILKYMMKYEVIFTKYCMELKIIVNVSTRFK